MDNTKLKKFAKSRFLKASLRAVTRPKEMIAMAQMGKEKLDSENVKKVFGSRVQEFKYFLKLIRAYAKGEYRNVAKKHVVLCLLAVIYFVNPVDLVPDAILGLGYIDDLAVINWVYLKLREEIYKFKIWEDSEKGELQ